MRPYLVLTLVVLAAVAAFGQPPISRPYGGCFYGCGPSIPLLTTPEISLEQYSPNPVGASNATTGLIAGATNSTLSQLQGSTSSVTTVAVWYQGGGAPLISREINLEPERISREGHPTHEPASAAHAPAAGPREIHPREAWSHEERAREEHGARHTEETRGNWTYFGREHTTARVYGNEDVTRQNEKNGTVKHDGKTLKI